LELTETVLVIHSLALCQAVDLRGPESCKLRSRELHQELRRHVPVNDSDRRMDLDIERVLGLYRSGLLPLGQAGN
jgi:histidine ammonia-lyase